jgi:aminoglycoside adenylyltransferase-like protein/nucleotidyltransferase-like protein
VIDDALRFAERLTAVTTRALGESVASVILQGSLVLDDYVPGRSDVDLLVIVDGSLDSATMDGLTHAVVAEQPSAPAPADLRVVTREVAARPPEPPPMELYVRLDRSAEPDIVSRDRGESDLIVELALSRERGRALYGAAPREVIGEVPTSSVVRVGDAQLARWQALTDDARHAALMVLTACRVWHLSESGRHCSKTAAARWALERDPSLDAIRAALRQRSGVNAPIEPADIARVLGVARAKIAATPPT